MQGIARMFLDERPIPTMPSELLNFFSMDS